MRQCKGKLIVSARLPKSVKRFSDKRRGENKRLEQKRDSKIVHFALAPIVKQAAQHQRVTAAIFGLVIAFAPSGFFKAKATIKR